MRFGTSAASLILAFGVLAAGCNHTPVSNLEKSFTLKVEAGTGDDSRVKIDFLWVVDNSTSMCQEQRALSENFTKFTDSLEKNFDVDARIAVTTVDAQCDNDNISIFAAKGKFNQHVDRSTPIACRETEKFACRTDGECSDCAVLDECGSDGEWHCSLPANHLEACYVNPNGSLNTTCERFCDTDQECRDLFGDDRYICLKASGSTGCVLPPPTSDCPDELPPFLEKNDAVDNTNLFKCIAQVGVTQYSCLRYEQPLKTAFLALNPSGINREQSLGFLRPDAYLVIIIISDEEDCSVAEGRGIFELEAFTCGLLDTTDNGGPLVPVAHFVNRFKALKDDPGRVIVATISGDSLKDGADADLDRSRYLESKGGQLSCNADTYICDSDVGTADYGARFIELADAFGPNGTFQNICSEKGLDQALVAIADTIVSVINRICLPKPILKGLTVSRIRQGVETVLSEGQGDGTYRVVNGAEDCAVDGVLLPSLTFGDAPQPGDQIKVTYQGDPQLL